MGKVVIVPPDVFEVLKPSTPVQARVLDNDGNSVKDIRVYIDEPQTLVNNENLSSYWNIYAPHNMREKNNVPTLKISNITLFERLWEPSEIIYWFEEHGEGILLFQAPMITKHANIWTVTFTNENDKALFASWFYGGSKGFRVEIKVQNNEEVKAIDKWIADNTKGDFQTQKSVSYDDGGLSISLSNTFRNEADAVFFKLRWKNVT